MLKKGKIRKLLALPMAVILSGTFIVSFFQARQEIYSLYQTFRESVSYTSIAEVNINRTIADETGAPASGETQEKNSSFYNLIFLLGSITLLNGAGSVISVIFLAFILSSGILNRSVRKQNAMLMSRLRHYKAWSLKFLTPLQKCILNRADEYDINPVTGVSGVLKPVFLLRRNTGFFYGLKEVKL